MGRTNAHLLHQCRKTHLPQAGQFGQMLHAARVVFLYFVRQLDQLCVLLSRKTLCLSARNKNLIALPQLLRQPLVNGRQQLGFILAAMLNGQCRLFQRDANALTTNSPASIPALAACCNRRASKSGVN